MLCGCLFLSDCFQEWNTLISALSRLQLEKFLVVGAFHSNPYLNFVDFMMKKPRKNSWILADRRLRLALDELSAAIANPSPATVGNKSPGKTQSRALLAKLAAAFERRPVKCIPRGQGVSPMTTFFQSARRHRYSRRSNGIETDRPDFRYADQVSMTVLTSRSFSSGV